MTAERWSPWALYPASEAPMPVCVLHFVIESARIHGDVEVNSVLGSLRFRNLLEVQFADPGRSGLGLPPRRQRTDDPLCGRCRSP